MFTFRFLETRNSPTKIEQNDFDVDKTSWMNQVMKSTGLTRIQLLDYISKYSFETDENLNIFSLLDVLDKVESEINK